MRILVIGGTNFIGPHVVRYLAAQGHDITVFHRGQHVAVLPRGVRSVRSAAAGVPVTHFQESLLSPSPDVIVHMMAMGEADARAAVDAFAGCAGRLVVVSSGDVYRAYGRFTGLEPGAIEPGPLGEDAPLRSVLYPYREQASSPDDLNYFYDKILAEREAAANPALSATILRLPKVYGQGGNADLATVYAYRHHPRWRWTHGYVENVAWAIALAATHSAAAGRVYNVGEASTPTVAERLRDLPPSGIPVDTESPFNFDQNIVYDTSRIRTELGYREPVSYVDGLRRTLAGVLRA